MALDAKTLKDLFSESEEEVEVVQVGATYKKKKLYYSGPLSTLQAALEKFDFKA